MIKSLTLENNDVIVEIGGGEGVITRPLLKECNLKKCNSLDVFEIDNNFSFILKSLKPEDVHYDVITGDFLKANLNRYENKWKIIGAIPYYITSPIIHKLLQLTKRPTIILLLIQDEVAEKLVSQIPKASYWTYITLGYKVEKISKVPPEAFFPQPKVNSAIVKFTQDTENNLETNDIHFNKWEKFLHHAYKNPRKMLKKNFDIKLLEKVKIQPDKRPQHISLKQWVNLYKKFN